MSWPLKFRVEPLNTTAGDFSQPFGVGYGNEKL